MSIKTEEAIAITSMGCIFKWDRGSISPTFYTKLLCAQIPKAKKGWQVDCILLNFWDLRVLKLWVKCWWNRPRVSLSNHPRSGDLSIFSENLKIESMKQNLVMTLIHGCSYKFNPLWCGPSPQKNVQNKILPFITTSWL